MIAFVRWTVLTASVALLAACTKPANDAAADEAAIREVNATFAKAYAARDVAAVAGHYTDDAVLSPPGTPAIRGMDAIREYWSNDMAAATEAGATLEFAEDSDVGVAGDLGWESGSVTILDKSGAVLEQAKYLTVFRKTDGRWLMLRDIYNSDSPPAAASTPAAAPTTP
jgi:uncharacterized protein (TIGR02246 family)